MISFLNPSNKIDAIIKGLLSVKDNEETFNRFTVLQNEISVSYNTKVTAIVGVKNDKLAAAFAKGYADAYSKNGLSCLIIDANLYNPCLSGLLDGDIKANVKDNNDNKSLESIALDDKVNAICMDKEIYPSVVYKAGTIQNLIKENKDKYQHFVVIMPSIKEHKEISLINDVVDSIILVTQKNVTTKKSIFNAIQYFSANELPLAKTIVLK